MTTETNILAIVRKAPGMSDTEGNIFRSFDLSEYTEVRIALTGLVESGLLDQFGKRYKLTPSGLERIQLFEDNVRQKAEDAADYYVNQKRITWHSAFVDVCKAALCAVVTLIIEHAGAIFAFISGLFR